MAAFTFQADFRGSMPTLPSPPFHPPPEWVLRVCVRPRRRTPDAAPCTSPRADCSQFLSVKSEFQELGLGESDREVSHRRRSGGQKIRVGLFGPRPTGRCRCRGVPLRRPGRRWRADGHGRAPVAATGRRQWQTAASGRLGMQSNQAHQVVGEHRRLDLVVEPPRNEWSARPQASRCAASARGRIRHTSRADNKADGRLWARPSGGRRNAPRGVAAA